MKASDYIFYLLFFSGVYSVPMNYCAQCISSLIGFGLHKVNVALLGTVKRKVELSQES